MRTPGRTVWDGGNVNALAARRLDDQLLLRLSGNLSANYDSWGVASGWGAQATAANFRGELVLVNDGAGSDTADACEPLPAGSLVGKIAFINRGGPPAPAPSCGFELKTLNAQNAGAIGVVIGNVATSANPQDVINMADDPTLVATIPAIQLGLSAANAIRAALPGGVTVDIGTVPGLLAGADAGGRTRLYTPTVVASGSTFSHFDTVASPNVLMEPFITDTLLAEEDLDLTPALLTDIGWTLNRGNAQIGNCTTDVPVVRDDGRIPGANVQAWSNLCLIQAKNKGAYQSCMAHYKNDATVLGLLSGSQGGSVTSCAAKITK
jgi:hypothetical protein